MYHEGLRHLAQWWPQHEIDGVGQRDLALSLVVLPAKERGYQFLDWFAANGSDALWQVRALRKMANACNQGLIDQIRDLPDERWEWGIQQVLPHLASPTSASSSEIPVPTIFHAMMVMPGLSVDEILSIGVLQGVAPRRTCLQWYDEHLGESGGSWPIPLMERLAERVFKGSLLSSIETLSPGDSVQALSILRLAIQQESSTVGKPASKKGDCCKS